MPARLGAGSGGPSRGQSPGVHPGYRGLPGHPWLLSVPPPHLGLGKGPEGGREKPSSPLQPRGKFVGGVSVGLGWFLLRKPTRTWSPLLTAKEHALFSSLLKAEVLGSGPCFHLRHKTPTDDPDPTLLPQL